VLELNIPASEITAPTVTNDPSTTTFKPKRIKSLVVKLFRKITHLLDRNDILDGNVHFDNLQKLIDYPDTSKKTFEYYFQINVPHLNTLFEIYPSQLLQIFTDFYSNELSTILAYLGYSIEQEQSN
jgi:hypothetical protein